jgi:hypothetical protein
MAETAKKIEQLPGLIQTPITRMFNIRHPVVLAGMKFV